ncbi:hypothetical protein EON73_03545 [bacterium]|nr:MAG: hypothetical protein EON73_03545 [bacterium]
MNSHLNIFKTYTNLQRTFQLENDLTRAFAISLQEDSLFFNEILKEVFFGTKFYSQLFDYEHIFAITLSETEIGDFWEAKNNRSYDPICDLVIKVNNVFLIIEAKRDNLDCTAQLYNQISNIINAGYENITLLNKYEHGDKITPIDLNWSKLMKIAVKVLSFEKSFGDKNRFLTDFVEFVKSHNHRWLPESPINSLQSNNRDSILRRIDSAIIEASKADNSIIKLHYNDRLGIVFNKVWAQEILFNVNENGDLTIAIYPGNTKAQGQTLFRKNPVFNKEIQILSEIYPVSKAYHIKFTIYQKYFAGLFFGDNALKSDLYTQNNFHKFTGRKKRNTDWIDIEVLFDNTLNYDWRDQCKWNDRIINSEKTQFDISFGYKIVVQIPFNKLKELDIEQSHVNNLAKLIEEINQTLLHNLLNTYT